MLVAIGMEAFAERARRELIATGERVRKRSVETRGHRLFLIAGSVRRFNGREIVGIVRAGQQPGGIPR